METIVQLAIESPAWYTAILMAFSTVITFGVIFGIFIPVMDVWRDR